MNTRSKKFLDTAAEVLNTHVAEDSDAGKLLAGDSSTAVVELLNEILRKVAEGGRLVAAVETSGELIGFVPRSSVPIPELPGIGKPPEDSPDN